MKKTELRPVFLDSSLVWDHQGLHSEKEPNTLSDSLPEQQKQDKELVNFDLFIY